MEGRPGPPSTWPSKSQASSECRQRHVCTLHMLCSLLRAHSPTFITRTCVSDVCVVCACVVRVRACVCA